MEPEKKRDPLERLERELYSPEAPLTYIPQKLSKKTFEVKEKWGDDVSSHDSQTPMNLSVKEKTVKKIFLWSLLFFVLASAFAVYRLFLGPIFNNKNVDFSFDAPTNVAGGEEQTLRITVKNNNRTDISSASFDITYPDGIQIVGSENVKERRINKELGVLLSGAARTEEIRFVAFGKEDEEKKMNIKLEYRIKGSSATFSQEKEYSFILSTSPLSLSFEAPDEINANESFTVNAEAVSNAPKILKNVALLLSYPSGFSIQSQNPKANRSNNMWVIGDMNPSDIYKLSFKGKLSGNIEDQKTFALSIGEANTEGNPSLDTVYNQNTKTITIKDAFVGIDFLCDGDKNEEIAITDNKEITCEINWRNNFSTNVLNGNFRIGITGSVIDRESIIVSKGFYKSDESAIYWDQVTDKSLAVLLPKDTGNFRFSFRTVPLLAGAQFQNPEIKFDLVFNGDRITTGQTSEQITISISKKVKVSSALTISSYGLYHTGKFLNTGPMPPAVDQKTTYTIIWKLTNSSNDIRNTQVTASLPIYSDWESIVSPFDENISFNETTKTIIWDVGTLPAGTGISSPSREVMFKISFVPSISQKRMSPILVSAPQLSGVDSFSTETVHVTGVVITTQLTKDPLFNADEESRVVE